MATEPISSRMAVALPRSPSPENHTPPRGMGAYQGKSIVRRPDSPSKFPGLIERVHSRVRPDELYKEDIVRSIFGDVGAPLEDFSCDVISRILLHGRMYVTPSFVCFYSNVFGFEKTIKIPFCHMQCITKEKTALFIPNAIAIITSKKEYVFRSFWDREDAFRILKQCHHNSLAQSTTPRDCLASLRESASLPSNTSPSREDEAEHSRRRAKHSSSSGGRASDKEAEDKAVALTQAGLRTGSGRRLIPWRGRSHRRRAASAGAVDAAGEQHARNSSGNSSNASGGAAEMVEREAAGGEDVVATVEDGSGSLGGARAGGHSAHVSLDGSDPCDESEVDVLGVEGESVGAVSLGSTMGGGQPMSKAEEFKLALSALGDGQPHAHRNSPATVRIEAELACSLKSFFELFFANDAEKGLPGFHESQGDSDVQSTPWKVAGGDLGMTREIRFVHPLSSAIGPSRTRAVKLQRCRLYGEHGIIVETSTNLEDILMSDYFQIEDRCVVQPGRDGGVHVDVEVQIKFFKNTMFRKTIQTKSLTETKEVWESFIGMAKDTIQARQPALPLPLSSGGQDSDDEGRVRNTRERLRERRKHRYRTRPPHHPHDKVQDALAASTRNGSSRPRAKSAAARVPVASVVEPAVESEGESAGSGVTAYGVSVRATPIPMLMRWLASFAALPWILLAFVFVVELVQYWRFSSEAAGFLEASEVAMSVLGAVEGVDSTEGVGVTREVLRGELVRGLTEVYARNRFFWPFWPFTRLF